MSLFKKRNNEPTTPPGAQAWPAVHAEKVPQLDSLLVRMCGADDLEALGTLVQPLQDLAEVSFLDRSRTVWEWFGNYSRDAATVPALTRMRIAFFASIWNENVKSSAYAWGLTLGYPTDEQMAEIDRCGLAASAEIEPSVEIAQGDSVGALQLSLAQRTGLPIPVKSPSGGADGGAVLEAFNKRVQEAESGDEVETAYVTGLSLAVAGDLQGAVPHLERAAGRGHVEAMYELGSVNSTLGRQSVATYWWEAAAGAGHLEALNNLAATAYQRHDYEEAVSRFAQLVQRGDVRGHRGLGAIALDAQDPASAVGHFRTAADQGDVASMLECARLIAQSGGGEPGPTAQAARYGELAAREGSAEGMFLAGLARAMLGNREVASVWLDQASSAGHTRAATVKQAQGL